MPSVKSLIRSRVVLVIAAATAVVAAGLPHAAHAATAPGPAVSEGSPPAGSPPAGPAVAPAVERFDPPPGSPAGSVGRVGSFLVDGEGRTLLLHGVSVRVTDVVAPDELDVWVREGINAVRLIVPVAADGGLAGLDTLAATVGTYTARNLRVVVRLSPARTDAVTTQAAATAAVEQLAAALRDVADLVGFEIAVPATVDPGPLAEAVRRTDPHHLLWRELPAAFDPAATVAAAGDAAYVVTWGDARLSTARRIYAATQTATMGWFYDRATVGAVVAEVIRPYPVAVAGTPTQFAGQRNGSFTLTYRTTAPDGSAVVAGAASAVVLPASIYPNGYTAAVTGGQVTSVPGAPVLCVVAAAGAATVSVAVDAAAAGASVPLAASTSVSSCEAPEPPTSPGTASAVGDTSTGSGGGSSGSGAAGADSASQASGESDDLALLVLFPLLGAVATALLLGGVVVVFRPRRQPSGAQSGERTSGD